MILPRDPATWDAAAFDAACNVMADEADHEESLLRGSLFGSLLVSREAFKRYCLVIGYPLPPFWFGARSRQVVTLKARRDCANWLGERVAAGPKPASKAALWHEAKTKFAGLSERGFLEIWTKTVPAEWRAAGAPAGSRDSKLRKAASRR
jgi:hypothetical protein